MPRKLAMPGPAPAQADPSDSPSVVRSIVNRVSMVCGVLSAVAIVFMTGGIALDVLLRTVTGHGLTGVIESVDPLLVAVAFLALSVTEFKGEHVALTLVTDRIAPRPRFALIAAGVAACILFVAMMAASGTIEAIHSVANNEIRAGVVRIPLWPARIALVLGALALLAQLGVTLVDAIRSAARGASTGVWVHREADASTSGY